MAERAQGEADGAPGATEASTPRPEPVTVDLPRLKALAHPLRVRMYDRLADGGPATASQLAASLGESSGTTSYHLRVLARHGFIQEDPDRGDRRDRWWTVTPGGYTLNAERFADDDPEASAALELVAGELWRNAAAQLERWYRTAMRWDPAWVAASVSTTMRVEATPEELAELRAEVVAVLEAFRARTDERDAPPGSRRLVAQFHAFPLGEPPAEDDGGEGDG